MRKLLFLLIIFTASLSSRAGELDIEQQSKDSTIVTDIASESKPFDISIQQLGESNNIALSVDSHLSGVIEQVGIGGLIQLSSAGTTQQLSIHQGGDSNETTIDLIGNDLHTTVSQTGEDNSIDYEVRGNSNHASLVQSGNDNTILLDQSGSGNAASLTQEGTGNLLDVSQYGGGMSLTIIQKGINDQIVIK